MERLTVWRKDGRASIENKGDRMTPMQQAMRILDVIDRLASIEDILGDDYDLEHLGKLLEAERDGRCVVFPCEVGDKVWIVRTAQDGKSTTEVYEFGKIKQISVNAHGTFLVGDYCHTLNAEKIGKSAFLSRKEAEQALREIVENGK